MTARERRAYYGDYLATRTVPFADSKRRASAAALSRKRDRRVAVPWCLRKLHLRARDICRTELVGLGAEKCRIHVLYQRVYV